MAVHPPVRPPKYRSPFGARAFLKLLLAKKTIIDLSGATLVAALVAAADELLGKRMNAFVIWLRSRLTGFVRSAWLPWIITLIILLACFSFAFFWLRRSRIMRTIIFQVIARVFGWWSRVRLGVQLGPGLGLVTQRLSDLDLSRAVPTENPPSNLLSEEARRQAYDSGPSEELRRANVWAGAIERQVRDKPKPRGTVLTTYGFVWLSGRVQLSVIYYLQPLAAFLARPPQPIKVGEESFPVIIRPWLAIGHSDGQGLDGNCWVTFPDGKGNRHPGVLTARHVVKQSLKVLRVVPRGRLRYESEKMDAAVIEVSQGDWGQKVPVQHSSVIGYKPVRLVSSQGMIDGNVVEHSDFGGGTIFAEPNKEPFAANHLLMNRSLWQGDSGCLVLDLEFAEFGQMRPYLIYLGEVNVGWGYNPGVGLLLEQAHRVWGLEFFQ